MDIDTGTKEYIQEKLGKLEKYLDMLNSIEAIISREDNRISIEAICRVHKQPPVVVKKETENIISGIDKIHDILEVQLARQKEKIKKHHTRESTRIKEF